MNANIEQLFRNWIDPISGFIKLSATFHTWMVGELSGVFNLTVYSAILDTAIGGFLLFKVISPWVKRWQIRSLEARALRRFRKVRSSSLCPFAAKAKLFAGSISKIDSLGASVEAIVPRLVEFTNVGKQRKLDGFVIELPCARFARDLEHLSSSFKCLLRELTKRDPSGVDCLMGNVLRKGWQFTFNKTRFFVTTFAPFYGIKHPRYSRVKDFAFVFFQPEYSFDNHGISSRNSHREKVKGKIRKSFKEAGSEYNISLIKQPFEALKYVKPMNGSDPPVRWWESKLDV